MPYCDSDSGYVDMVDTYNDLETDEIFGKYFDENGIREDIKPEINMAL